MIANCLACQANTPVAHSEPLQMYKLPGNARKEVTADFYGPLKTGEYMLVITGNVFLVFGVPKVAKTINGHLFNSDYFSKFLLQEPYKLHGGSSC